MKWEDPLSHAAQAMAQREETLCETQHPRIWMEMLLEESFPAPRSHANSIYLATGAEYPSKVILIREPKKKEFTFPY